MFEMVIDTGGTFTGAVLVDGSRQISTAKYLTKPAEPSQSILGCIDVLANDRDLKKEKLLSDTTTLAIGTTLSTNCVLEKRERIPGFSWHIIQGAAIGTLPEDRGAIY